LDCCPGTTTDLSQGTKLSDLSANCQLLLDTGQLFHGHAKFRRVYNTRNHVQLRDCVLRHVSAHGLTSVIAPASLKNHINMSSNDKCIWGATYDEEFDNLTSLPTWEVITEEQFRRLSKGMKALPTMAIATIKCDEHNRPKHAKYQIGGFRLSQLVQRIYCGSGHVST
jgi:hypothetical protein